MREARLMRSVVPGSPGSKPASTERSRRAFLRSGRCESSGQGRVAGCRKDTAVSVGQHGNRLNVLAHSVDAPQKEQGAAVELWSGVREREGLRVALDRWQGRARPSIDGKACQAGARWNCTSPRSERRRRTRSSPSPVNLG